MTSPTNPPDFREAAEAHAERTVECICDPTHPFYDTGTCWFHMPSTEQAAASFVAGASHGYAKGREERDQDVALMAKNIRELETDVEKAEAARDAMQRSWSEVSRGCMQMQAERDKYRAQLAKCKLTELDAKKEVIA